MFSNLISKAIFCKTRIVPEKTMRIRGNLARIIAPENRFLRSKGWRNFSRICISLQQGLLQREIPKLYTEYMNMFSFFIHLQPY